jgi:hypothetical protein
MAEEQTTPITTEKKQRLLSIFEKLLPLVDSLADKIRFVMIIGVLTTIWLVVWFFFLKHFAIGITLIIGFAGLLPTLILARFWWALEELKNLPDIASQMVGDAKTELQASVQNIRAGKIPKLGFFSAGKSLWSISSMASEVRELMGSYISVAMLVNPFMLILGFVSIAGVLLLFLTGIVLVFFAF